MRIHSNVLTESDIHKACSVAGYTLGSVRPTTLDLHGSRSHARAFRVNLTGSNTRMQNAGTAYPSKPTHYAATYDEWGRFLAYLFDLDPTMKCDYYADRADFHAKTKGAYLAQSASA